MTALWTSEDAESATLGICLGQWTASGLSIDTRTLEKGDIFIALEGPNFDGHTFVKAALEAGAAGAMVHKAIDDVDQDKILMVNDTMDGLRDLAAAARARSNARIVAVTGSVGKTGVKEMLRLTLGQQGKAHATAGNLNNQWGLPLSLARMPEDTDFGIFEIGMNHPGEIRPLTTLARPHVAIVTAIEAAHTEFFNSTEDIANTKAEIFEGLEPDGVAVINRDTPHFKLLADKTCGHKVVSFGRHIESDLRLIARTKGVVHAVTAQSTLSFTLGVPGQHWAMNALSVLLSVDALGADMSAAAESLSQMTAPKGRGQRHDVAYHGGSFAVVDDSYNASPASIRAGLAVLSQDNVAGRRLVALGDMLELGEKSPQLHGELAPDMDSYSIDLVFTAGPLMAHLYEALPEHKRGGHANDSEALSPMITDTVEPGDVVLVKGSAGSRMGSIVDALLALATRTGIKGDMEQNAL